MEQILFNIDREIFEALRNNNGLETLVKNYLLKEKIQDIKISKEDEEKYLKSFCEQNKLDNEKLQKFLSENYITRESLIDKLTLKQRVIDYSSKEFGHKAESIFLKNKEALDKIVYSLIRVEDIYQAKELYLRISEGESEFGETAKQFSKGSEKYTRGIVGPVPLNNAHPKLLDFFRSAEVGKVYEPISVENWHLIVRVEHIEEAKLDELVSSRISEELFNQELKKEVESFILTMLKKHYEKSNQGLD